MRAKMKAKFERKIFLRLYSVYLFSSWDIFFYVSLGLHIYHDFVSWIL